MYVHSDYHTHTRHSHGQGTVAQNAAAAAARGLRCVAISDHGPANLFGVGVADLHAFSLIRKEIEKVREVRPHIEVLLGVEANVVSTEGHLDIPSEMQGGFDVVLAGLHPWVRPLSLFQWGRLSYLNAHGRGSRRALVANTDALVAAVYCNRIDVITHPGYRMPVDTRELARACVVRGTALEINTGHDHISIEYIRLAADEGAEFVIGSDAHSPERVGDFARGVELALRAGLTVDQIRNASAETDRPPSVLSRSVRVHSK